MTKWSSGIGTACLVILVATGSPAIAQVVVRDDRACGRCTIEATTVAHLGTADGPGALPSRPTFAAVDAGGRYWLTFNRDVPLVFDASGTFLRAVGTVGSGPEEFRSPVSVFIASDSVVVLDLANLRASIVAPDLTVRRSVGLPGPIMVAAAVHWPRLVLLSGSLVVNNRRMPGIHIASFENAVIAPEEPVTLDSGTSADDGWAQLRGLAKAAGNSVWIADPFNYQLRQVGESGRIIRTLRRAAAWFAGNAQLPIGSPTEPPSTRIQGVSLDAQGRIWVFSHIPAETWKQAWPEIPRGTREVASGAIQVPFLFRTRIEVIDLERRVLVTSHDMDGWVVAGLPGGSAAMYHENAFGVPIVRIVRFGLQGGV